MEPPRTHDLKTWPEFYRLVKDGLKPFELRKNDRDYQVGDYLILREWEPTTEAYTGDVTIAKVLSIVNDQTFLQPGYVAMGIEVLA